MRECKRYDRAKKLQALAMRSEGKSVNGIARELGIPEGTVRGWVKRAAQVMNEEIPVNRDFVLGMTRDELAQFHEEKKEESRKLMREITSTALVGLSKYVEAMAEQTEISRADAQTLATVIGIMTDKSAVLGKEPTQIIEGSIAKFEDL